MQRSQYLLVALCILVVVIVVFYFFYTTRPIELSTHLSEDETLPKIVEVSLTVGMSRKEIAEEIGKAFSYDEKEAETFFDTYRSMQWDAFNQYIEAYFVNIEGFDEDERMTLLTHSNVYLDEYDVLDGIYMPKTYELYTDMSPAEIAGILNEVVLKSDNPQSFVFKHMNKGSILPILQYVKRIDELLPDLVPLPPQDLGIREENGQILLVFSTVYYNKGDGNLELRADPSTIGVIGDFDRNVSQRIYKKDGSYAERPSGTFLWHNPHLHYHFADFVTYELTDVDGNNIVDEDTYLQKSTFCIRDVSKVEISESFEHTDANYKICGRERQGISVGWGDAYFFTYPDQNIPITSLPSGDYKLTFHVNPEDRFDEITKDNNISYALFRYDKDASTVEILKTWPEELPQFEHIYIEQIFES